MTNNYDTNHNGITNNLVDEILDEVKLILDLNGDDEQLGDMSEQEIHDLIEEYM